jgi:alkaline phosphatase
MKKVLFLLLVFIINSCVSVKVSDNTITKIPPQKKDMPKNIIFLIGDGMGLSHVSSGLYYDDKKTNFERFPVIGLIKTSSATHLISDSAAGATAFSTGEKTFKLSIGMDIDSLAVETVLEFAEKKGYNTGLIVTKDITNATPAAFYAHVINRYKYEDIASFLPSSNIDFLAGGGLKYMNKRKDKRNLIDEMKNNGYIIDTIVLPERVSTMKHLILLAEDDLPKMIEGRGNFLSEATQLGINKLGMDDKKYFLMVEGSQIDTGGHDMDIEYMLTEQMDFDKVVGEVLDFAMENGETLVVVTADHETGDFALSMVDGDYNKMEPRIYSSDHSATMVPVFAYGPGSELFGGVYENTDIYHKIKSFISESSH